MGKKINSLLKKKSWTGAEVGKLLIASMLNDIEGQRTDTYKPLFTQHDFEKLENSIDNNRDFLEYGVYTTLYSAIIDAFNKGSGLNQQFYNGYHRLLTEFLECLHSDKSLRALDNEPLIMTEKQYYRLKAESRKELESHNESFCSLLFNCLEYFLCNESEAPNDIKKALEYTKSVPAKGNILLKHYNETYRIGYYQLPNGVRSDQLSNEEWQKAIETYYLKTHKLIINGEKAGFQETIDDYYESYLMKIYELLFNGIDAVKKYYLEKIGEELPEEETEGLMEALEALAEGNKDTDNKALNKLLPYLGYDNIKEWHYYEEAPEGLNLYDLLEMYTYAYSGNYQEIDTKTANKLLKEDAPELYKALKKYIETSIVKVNGLKANQLYKDIITWGELAKLNFLEYEKLTTPEDCNIIDAFLKDNNSTKSSPYSSRVNFKGIAIMKNPHSTQIDKNGDYIEEDSPLHSFSSLDSLNESEQIQAYLLSFLNDLVKPAMRYIYAYNTLLGLLGNEYDLPDLQKIASFDTSIYENKLDAYNSMLYVFYHDVYGNKEEKERKRTIIKKLFYPVDVEEFKPTQEAIKSVETELKELGISYKAKKRLRNLDALLDRLTVREGASN